jgi:hypothetical protein
MPLRNYYIHTNERWQAIKDDKKIPSYHKENKCSNAITKAGHSTEARASILTKIFVISATFSLSKSHQIKKFCYCHIAFAIASPMHAFAHAVVHSG